MVDGTSNRSSRSSADMTSTTIAVDSSHGCGGGGGTRCSGVALEEQD